MFLYRFNNITIHLFILLQSETTDSPEDILVALHGFPEDGRELLNILDKLSNKHIVINDKIAVYGRHLLQNLESCFLGGKKKSHILF
jgi:hypothetical protein